MKVWLALEKQEREVGGVKTVRQLLNHFSYKEEEVLVINKKESRLLTLDEKLEKEMDLRIIRVVSGG